MVAQPQADEVTFLLRIRVIVKGGPAVSQGAIVDELHLTLLEVEIER